MFLMIKQLNQIRQISAIITAQHLLLFITGIQMVTGSRPTVDSESEF